jgi:2'-5' RNA ligase
VSGERARLFVALELPDEVRAALVAWRAEAVGGVSALRMVAPQSLHVTLCFLGSLPASEIEPISATLERALGGAAGGALAELSLGAPTWLPRRRPNVLAVRVEDSTSALTSAQSKLARALADGGWYAPEGRPFLAHVTVARVGRRRVRPVELASPPALSFTGAAITLFRSRTDPGGARYEALHRV